MEINKSVLSLPLEISKCNILNWALGEIDFSWWLEKAFKSFFMPSLLSFFMGKEDTILDKQFLAQEIGEKGDFSRISSKENFFSEKMNLMEKLDSAELSWEKFVSLINALPPSLGNDLLAQAEIIKDLILTGEARGKDEQEKPALMEKKEAPFSSPKNGQDKTAIGQETEKLTSWPRLENLPLNSIYKGEDRLLNLDKGDNSNFPLLKNIDQKGEKLIENKEPLTIAPFLDQEKMGNAVIEVPKEKVKSQQGMIPFLGREKIELNRSDYLGPDTGFKNGWFSLLKEEGTKLTSSWTRESKFEHFSLLIREYNEPLPSKVEQFFNNLASPEKNFFISFLKGEKKGEIKWDNISPFPSERAYQDPILSRDTFSALGEVWRKENIPSQRAVEAEIYKQISQRIIWSIKNDQELIKVTLEPPHLGNIYLEISREKENIRAKIWAENPLTKELIEQNIWPIQKIIEKEGFKLERCDVFSQLDMGFWTEAQEEHLCPKGPGKFSPWVAENSESMSSENSLPLDFNKGWLNILV